MHMASLTIIQDVYVFSSHMYERLRRNIKHDCESALSRKVHIGIKKTDQSVSIIVTVLYFLTAHLEEDKVVDTGMYRLSLDCSCKLTDNKGV